VTVSARYNVNRCYTVNFDVPLSILWLNIKMLVEQNTKEHSSRIRV